MKIIFLDIDGVLNSLRTYAIHNSFPHNLSGDMRKFDRTAIDLLRRLCQVTGAKVVVSSYWRTQYTCEQFSRAIPGVDFIDRTDDQLGIRGEQVKRWLDAHPEVEAYVILDDTSDFLADQVLLQTSMDTGLDYWHFYEAVRILNPEALADYPKPETKAHQHTSSLQWGPDHESVS